MTFTGQEINDSRALLNLLEALLIKHQAVNICLRSRMTWIKNL